MNKEQLYANLKQIWPSIYRIVNNGIYFVMSVIRSIVRIAIDQIKGNGQ